MKYKKLFKKLILHIFVVSIFFSLFNVLSTNNHIYGKEKKPTVLFISSYTQSFPSVPDQIEGLRSIFDKASISMDIEFMDTKRFETNKSKQLFYDMIKYKLDNLKTYDAIVVGDDSALQFAMDYQYDLFVGLPIVFLGINDIARAQIANKNNNITGIIEETSLEENISIALKFNPKATKIVAVVDNTYTGIGDRDQFYRNKDKFPKLTFDDINFSQYSLAEIPGVFENIEDNTIVLFLSMYKDKNDFNITIDQGATIISQHTKAPVYRAAVGGLGKGILGGKVVSYLDSGKIAGKMVVDILNGRSIESIEMVSKSPNNYMFDYNIIGKYKIDEKLIPKDAILINLKQSFYEENKARINTTFKILSFLLILISGLIYDNINRKKIKKRLLKNRDELSETFEELAESEEELKSQFDTISEHALAIEILNEKFELAIEGNNSAIWQYNCKNKKLDISDHIKTLINKDLDNTEDIHGFMDQILSSEIKIKLMEEYNNYVEELILAEKSRDHYELNEGRERAEFKGQINIQLPVKQLDQTTKWFLVRGKGILDSNYDLNLLYGIVLDITKLKQQEEHIEYLASRDYLTNLPNKRMFMTILEKEIKDSNSGAIIILDLDDFKKINDVLGHIFGDEILKEVANRLTSISGDKLFVSRLAGDEFLILICGVNTKEEVLPYVFTIKNILKKAIIINNTETYINFSMGITGFPSDANDVDQLIMNADTAMYKVKSSGKNSYMFYQKEMKEELDRRIEIELILRNALKNDGFYLVYQPQVNVETGSIIGFEALIRLKEHKISPLEFIKIAEEVGIILGIGRWVALEVVKQIAAWREMGFDLKPVAINFSSIQIKDTDFHLFLQDILREHKVDPKYIEIEITESILVEDSDNTLEFLDRLKEIGVSLTLDDFGTGFSSLSYLTFLPVHKIKIDKSLSDKFLEVDNVQTMNSIIALAHSLGMVITAEGIEDIKQYRRLKDGYCDYIQGYLFSKPLVAKELEDIYSENLLDKIVHLILN